MRLGFTAAEPPQVSPDLKDLKDYLSTCGFEVLELSPVSGVKRKKRDKTMWKILGMVRKLGDSDHFIMYTYIYIHIFVVIFFNYIYSSI